MKYEVKADSLESAFDKVAISRSGSRFGKRPMLDSAHNGNTANSAFVDGYLRKGAEMEMKSIRGNVPSEGGYAVPEEIDAVIDATLKNASPIRAIANVVQVGTSGYRKLVTSGGAASGWAAEDAARAETETPEFNEVTPSFGDLFANPAATQTMLDDTAFDVEAWLSSEIANEFAKAEGSAFVNGDGVDKPKGFLQEITSDEDDSIRAFGTLQYVVTGESAGFSTIEPENALLDLVHSLRAPYRQGAVWVMNSATLASIRKMKTADGAFLWQAGLGVGQPDTLLGYPVVEAEDMPDIGDGSLSVAFGNFQAGYLIAERGETAILRDPYSNKPYVHFYATKRVGGAVSNSEAIKLLKFTA